MDFERLAAALESAPPRSVIVMVGAGMSVSAGIPDFRTPGTGLYDNLQKYNLPWPEAIFDIRYFTQEDPAPFYRLCRELWPGTYAPTAAHRFLVRLHECGKLLRCFTQNIDSLETAAGLPADMVVAAHGNFDSAELVDPDAPRAPRREIPMEELREAVFHEGENGWRALNHRYGGLVKPKITFFGESLPQRFGERAMADFPKCKLLLIFGTSLKVQPFASLVRLVPPLTPRLLVNRDRVGEDMGLDFDQKDEQHPSDVFYSGDCDDGARELCALAHLGHGVL
jgi:NAD-dependent SIR2 family protein deacetylase